MVWPFIVVVFIITEGMEPDALMQKGKKQKKRQRGPGCPLTKLRKLNILEIFF